MYSERFECLTVWGDDRFAISSSCNTRLKLDDQQRDEIIWEREIFVNCLLLKNIVALFVRPHVIVSNMTVTLVGNSNNEAVTVSVVGKMCSGIIDSQFAWEIKIVRFDPSESRKWESDVGTPVAVVEERDPWRELNLNEVKWTTWFTATG